MIFEDFFQYKYENKIWLNFYDLDFFKYSRIKSSNYVEENCKMQSHVFAVSAIRCVCKCDFIYLYPVGEI
jgi:hypothetical protein